MSILPASNVINVTISDTPSGLTRRNVNSLALFTTEQPDTEDTYTIHIGASTVAELYGTDSVPAQMANAIFAQTPNILSGDGRLITIPMLNAVSATHGTTTTANLSANLAALIAVSNGDLRVTINSVNHDLTGVNFTSAVTLADIAAILQAALTSCVVTNVGNTIVFTSKTYGTTSTAVIAALSGGMGTNLAGSTLLNTAGSTPVSGANATGETLAQAITRMQGVVGFVPVITDLKMPGTVVKTTADFIQARDNMYVQEIVDTADIAAVGAVISAAGDKKTRIVLYTVSDDTANLMKAAYAGRAFSTNFDGSNTSQTMNLKQLATIDPDTGITQTIYDAANTAGVDLYVSYDGVPSVYSTGGNDFFDNPYGDLALKFYLVAGGFNYLRQTNTKVPQTEPGMNGLKNAYAQVCNQFVRNASLAPGSWTSSETFGDPQIFKDNIANYGYYIYSLPISQQDAESREQREAPLVQIAVKRAGAIQSSDVIVIVNS